MFVQMKTLSAGPAGVREPGKKYEVTDEEGEQLLRGRHAIELDADGKPVQRPAVETAMIDHGAETTTLESAKPRKK